MKQNRSLITGLLTCSLALALAASLQAQDVHQGTVKVVRIAGNARYMAPGSTVWEPLKAGAILSPGAVIQTAENSYVDVVLNNTSARSAFSPTMTPISSYQPAVRQDAVRIFENSVLAVDKLTTEQTGADVVSDTQLDLKAGRIFGTVKKLTAASKFEIKIPNGVAGIRGTIFYISASGLVSVVEGAVVVAYVGPNGQPATMEVPQGMQFDVTRPAEGNVSIPPNTPVPGTLYKTQMPITFTPTVDQTIIRVSPTTPQTSQSSPPPTQGQG